MKPSAGKSKEAKNETKEELESMTESENEDKPGARRCAQGRQQYTREYKLHTIQYAQKHTLGQWTDKHGKTQQPMTRYKVAQKFNITPTMLRRWMRNADQISQQREGQRREVKGRVALFPEMEKAVHERFLAARAKGMKVKRDWFLNTARNVFEEYYPQQVHVDERGTKQYVIAAGEGGGQTSPLLPPSPKL